MFRSNARQVIKRLNNKLQKIKHDAPDALANEGQKLFLQNFKDQAWNGETWKRRSPKSKSNQPLLIGKTRRLRNAVANSIRKVSMKQIVWKVDEIPYAAVHNYGLKAGRGRGFLMPQRKFMGDSMKLRKALRSKFSLIIRANLKK